MITLAAGCYLVGVAIGLRFDIRTIISATIVALFGALGTALMGWKAPGDALFGAFIAIASLQSGYVSIIILDSLGLIAPKELPASATLKARSGSDNPSHR